MQLGNALFYLTNNVPSYRSAFQVNRQDHFEVVGGLSAYANASGSGGDHRDGQLLRLS